jgi:hypothetical protein
MTPIDAMPSPDLAVPYAAPVSAHTQPEANQEVWNCFNIVAQDKLRGQLSSRVMRHTTNLLQISIITRLVQAMLSAMQQYY